MRVGKLFAMVCLCFVTALPAVAGVWVSAPGSANVSKSGTATATSPVHFLATATSPACSKGVSTVGIYTSPNSLAYTVNGSNLDTNLTLNAGTYNVVVQEWDNCGWSSKAAVTLTVTSSGSGSGDPPPSSAMSFSNLQNQKGWSGYALLPPSWGICASCTSTGAKLQWSWTQKIASPSMDGLSAKSVYGGGNYQWGDVLWNNHLIGSFSSQGLADTKHTLNPSLHTFTYDVYFWVKDASVSQALEFDINQFTGGKSYIWGHECRIAGGHQWDIYDDVNHKWMATGVPCNPISGAWNHLILNVQRTSSNQLLFKTITLNGKTATINHTEPPTSTSWNGVTINYQLDGNRYGTPYVVYLDKLTFTMQ
jgi:hypothetical protein